MELTDKDYEAAKTQIQGEYILKSIRDCESHYPPDKFMKKYNLYPGDLLPNLLEEYHQYRLKK